MLYNSVVCLTRAPLCGCGILCLTVEKSAGKNVFFNNSRVQNFECLVPDRPVTILPRWRMKASDLTADYAKRSRSGTPVQSLSIKLSYNKNKPCCSLLIISCKSGQFTGTGDWNTIAARNVELAAFYVKKKVKFWLENLKQRKTWETGTPTGEDISFKRRVEPGLTGLVLQLQGRTKKSHWRCKILC